MAKNWRERKNETVVDESAKSDNSIAPVNDEQINVGHSPVENQDADTDISSTSSEESSDSEDNDKD